jgi:hypothetical protein
MEVFPEIVAIGSGLTVTTKLVGFPVQPFAVGWTVMVEVVGAFKLLPKATNDGISRLVVPLSAKPIVLLLLFHTNDVFETELIKETAPCVSPLHNVLSEIEEIVGV